MPRIALLIEYIGNNFHGSQAQNNQRTVQGDLEQALLIYLKTKTTVIFSGRTDAGVHASGQVAHIDVPSNIDLHKFIWAINGILKNDVALRKVQFVDNSFHARYSAIERSYVYRILNARQRSPLLRKTHFFISAPLDIAKMEVSSQKLIGCHDFKAFKSSNSDTSTSICTINSIKLINLHEDCLEVIVKADHFVYNMMRIIVGSLIEIGLNKLEPATIDKAIINGNRDCLGPTAPAWGLELQAVKYPPQYNLFC